MRWILLAIAAVACGWLVLRADVESASLHTQHSEASLPEPVSIDATHVATVALPLDPAEDPLIEPAKGSQTRASATPAAPTGSPPSAQGANARSSGSSSEAEANASFEITGDEAGDVESIFVSPVAHDLLYSIAAGAEHGPLELALPSGRFIAAAFARGRYGPTVEFELGETPRTVQLDAPAPFDLVFQVKDAESGALLFDSSAWATRSGLPEAWASSAPVQAESDTQGVVRLVGLCKGLWQVSAQREGYASASHVLDLPGNGAAKLESTGFLDLERFELLRELLVGFELVGAKDSDVTSFQISHTHRGEKVSFDEDGHAHLVLGEFSEPLYVKLWYPDGREAIAYLDAGLPDEGSFHPLDVGGSRHLEVDLRFGAGVASELSDQELWLRSAYRSAAGDSRTVGVKVTGPGVFEFADVQAPSAVISLFSVGEGDLRSEWGTTWVDLEPNRAATATLLIEDAPLRLEFRDNHDHPIAGFHYEIYQLPATTTWCCTGNADSEGTGPAPRVTERPCALYGYAPDLSVVAIDVPMVLVSDGDSLIVALAPTEPTFAEASVLGEPVEGVTIRVLGEKAHAAFLHLTTDPSGRSKSYPVTLDSRAVMTLASEDFWWPYQERPLRIGRNDIELFRVAQLEVPVDARLAAITFLPLGKSLATLDDAGLVDLVTSSEKTRTLRIPQGSYEATDASGESRVVVVGPGTTTLTWL